MLILSRKLEESIIIDDNIEIKVVELGNGRVKLGISAPREIEILRKELYDEVEDSNKASTFDKNKLKDIKNIFKKK